LKGLSNIGSIKSQHVYYPVYPVLAAEQQSGFLYLSRINGDKAFSLAQACDSSKFMASSA